MHLAGLPHQQPLVLLGHVTDVVPEQGNPLELAQILAAVHPELPGGPEGIAPDGNQDFYGKISVTLAERDMRDALAG